jgi:hypothetical protein
MIGAKYLESLVLIQSVQPGRDQDELHQETINVTHVQAPS